MKSALRSASYGRLLLGTAVWAWLFCPALPIALAKSPARTAGVGSAGSVARSAPVCRTVADTLGCTANPAILEDGAVLVVHYNAGTTMATAGPANIAFVEIRDAQFRTSAAAPDPENYALNVVLPAPSYDGSNTPPALTTLDLGVGGIGEPAFGGMPAMWTVDYYNGANTPGNLVGVRTHTVMFGSVCDATAEFDPLNDGTNPPGIFEDKQLARTLFRIDDERYHSVNNPEIHLPTATVAQTGTPIPGLQPVEPFLLGESQLTEVGFSTNGGLLTGSSETFVNVWRVSNCADNTLSSVVSNRLGLDIVNAQRCYKQDDTITLQVNVACLQQATTGFQAFLEFDPNTLQYQPAGSAYSGAPFPQHVQDILTAEVAAGLINLDGSDNPNGAGTAADSTLATLEFKVLPGHDGAVTSIGFRTVGPFASELSAEGEPIPTYLVPSISFGIDQTPPALTCPADIAVDTDTGSCAADLDPGDATVSDDCGIATFDAVRDDAQPMGAPFASGCGAGNVTTITWTATDCAGHVSTCMQTVTVTDHEAPALTCPSDIVIECDESTDPAHTGTPADPTDNCTAAPALTYSDHITPGACANEQTITRTWRAEDDCGNVTSCGQLITVQDTEAPIITSCPADVDVQCVADADPGIPFGVAEGGIGIYYNDNGLGENPANQAYFKAQYGVNNLNGAEFTFDSTPLTGFGPLTWPQIYSGLVPPATQFGFDLVVELPTSITNPVTPFLTAVDNVDSTPGNATPAGPVAWAINDYKGSSPNNPGNPATAPTNSILRGPSPITGSEVELFRNDLTLSGTVYTSVLAGRLTADGVNHWFAPGTPHSPMSNYNLSGLIYFSGTLTYDTATDTDPLMDFYAGTLTFTANHPSAETGFALATDNCTLFPVVTYSDTDNGGAGCPASPLVITRTWAATDDCGQTDTCEQTITAVDDTAPVFLSVPDDLNLNADAGGCTATRTPAEIGAPVPSDNCDLDVTLSFVRSDGASNLDDPFDPADSPITITWTAADDCGNSTQHVQTVVVNAVNDVTATVVLNGVNAADAQAPPMTRCIKFIAKNGLSCATAQHVSVTFSGSPATGVAHFTVPCGNWTSLCAKDEQHTKWASVALNVGATEYDAAAPLGLVGGDTDNDGDIDINDVTLLLVQFGTAAHPGGCPWNGTRDADFSNNGGVQSEDYTFLTASWLTTSSCPCMMRRPLSERSGSAVDAEAVAWTRPITATTPAAIRAADLNNDDVIDFRDVQIFERRQNLGNVLSERIRDVTLHPERAFELQDSAEE